MSCKAFLPFSASTRWLVRVAALLVLAACTTGKYAGLPPPHTVERVDLNRYLGVWYEIASIPNSFQRGCVATQATYTQRPDGRIGVENQCRQDSLDGPVRRAAGVAWVADDDPARLKVQFFWPFKGDYWIIELDENYRYAVVGHPTRDYLWILSRTPSMDPKLYQELLQRSAAQGYDPADLRRTLQPAVPGSVTSS